MSAGARGLALAIALTSVAGCRQGTFIVLTLTDGNSFLARDLLLEITNAGRAVQVTPSLGSGIDLSSSPTLSLELADAQDGAVDVTATAGNASGDTRFASGSVNVTAGSTASLTLRFEDRVGSDGGTSDAAVDMAPAKSVVSFAAPRAFHTGPLGTALALGKLDNDPFADLAVLNLSDSSVSVLMAGQPELFHPATNHPVSQMPVAVTIGDFDGDGKGDLVVVGPTATQSLTILRGHGDGTFDAPRLYDPEATGGATALVSGDINGDKLDDLAIVYADDATIRLYIGFANGGDIVTYSSSLAVPTMAGQRGGLAIGDFDGDKKLDLAITDPNNGQVQFFRGHGDAAFDAAKPTNGVFGAEAMITGDADGDGKLDLVVRSTSTISFLSGNGDGTFNMAVTATTTQGDLPMALGDFNRDGKLDLAVADGITGNVDLLLFKNGRFQLPLQYYAGNDPTAVAATDVDGDGALDLIASNGSGESVCVIRGDGAGHFITGSNQPGAGGTGDGVLADFNHDGKLDLARASGSTIYYVQLGNGDGTLGPLNVVPTPQTHIGMIGAQLTPGGEIDLISTNDSDHVNVMLGHGDGTFDAPVSYVTGSNLSTTRAVIAVDLDGDKLLDLVATDLTSNDVAVLLQSPADGGAGATFLPAQLVPAPGAGWLAGGDLDGDGKLDVVALAATTNQLVVLRGDGTGHFAAPVLYPTMAGALPGALTDVDGDGHLDVILASSGGMSLSFYRGKGDGTFMNAASQAVDGTPIRMIAGNFDGMHPAQLVLTFVDRPELAILTPDATGLYSVSATYGNSSTAAWFGAGDLNGDQLPDLVFPSFSESFTTVFLNTSH